MNFDELSDEQKIQVAKGFDATPLFIPFTSVPNLLVFSDVFKQSKNADQADSAQSESD